MPDSRSSASEYSRTSVSINSSSDEDDGSESEISVFSGNGRETRLICQNANQHREQVNAINSTVSIGPHINTHGSGKVTIKNYFGGTEIAPEALRSIIHNSISDDSNRKEIGDSQERPQSAENTSTNINERSYHSSPIQSDSIHARIRQWSAQISSNLTKNDKLTLFICIILFIVIPASALTVYFTIYEIEANIPEPSTQESIKEQTTLFTETDDNSTSEVDLLIVERAEWGAEQPSTQIVSLEHPVQYVIIAHTATRQCSDNTSCASKVQDIQNSHMLTLRLWDIAFSFLIGGDGQIYTGRGWDKECTSLGEFNARSIFIAFIGSFYDTLPSASELRLAKDLIISGVKLGKISSSFKLLGHCQVSDTNSPGEKLYAELKRWPHWTSEYHRRF